MNPPLHSFAWRFGGPLAGLPPVFAWSLLALAAVLGGVLIILSYRRTLVVLAPRPRRLLIALRLLLWLGLLLALAGPTRVERTFFKNETRPLAVLVDHSSSMTTPDNRKQRRLDDALRLWRLFAPIAESAHGTPRFFAFADTPAPVSVTDLADLTNLPSGNTRLFASLDHLLAEAPAGGWGGIVTLTDGLDTTGATSGEAIAATTRAAATPLYLLPGHNRHAGRDFLALRELTVPPLVPPRSTFRLEVTLDTYQRSPRELPLRLKVGDTWREPETLHLAAGRRALSWSAEIPADAPGLLSIELVAGTEPDASRARAEVRIASPATTRILYYQGALDWGYRFLADVLRRDPGFTLTPIFTLAPIGSPRPNTSVAGSLPDLPAQAAGYDAFDIVVLANAAASQLSPAQQAALTAWVRSGGTLLFLAPDDASTRAYSGSELEKMLPVVFASTTTDKGENAGVADFRNRMRALGDANSRIETESAKDAPGTSKKSELSSFVWEPRAATLFGAELIESAPRFANYARVDRAKPGADVLARHPTDPASNGDGRAILLALQRYGRGQSAVLTSDALWRWKLDQPSRERGVEKFWQNLFAWLGRERQRGIRFERAPLLATKDHELTLRVVAPSGPLLVTARPEASATAPLVDTTPITLTPSGESGEARLFTWKPAALGTWIIEARLSTEEPTRHFLTVTAKPAGEASGIPTDEALLRALAERTGGAVLTDSPPPAWRSAAAAGNGEQLLRETAEPLWQQGWIFATLLALYALELILRRCFQLL